MVTMNKVGSQYSYNAMEIYGLSTDEKPIDTFKNRFIANGSVFVEMDTAKVYFYDEDTDQWIEAGGGLPPTPGPEPGPSVLGTLSSTYDANTGNVALFMDGGEVTLQSTYTDGDVRLSLSDGTPLTSIYTDGDVKVQVAE